MANEIIKKVVISKKDIDAVSDDGLYFLRYRIVSEDKSRTSHWSPIYSVDGGGLKTASAGTSLISLRNEGSEGINISWGIVDTLKINNYDVYVRYDYGTSSVWNGATNTTATTLTGFVATLTTGTNNVTLTTGNTVNMRVGQSLTKTSGSGAFNAGGVVITSITGQTTFTVGALEGNDNGTQIPLNHLTAGSITFSATGGPFVYITTTSSTSIILPKYAYSDGYGATNATEIRAAVLAQNYPKPSNLASFRTTPLQSFLVESNAFTVV